MFIKDHISLNSLNEIKRMNVWFNQRHLQWPMKTTMFVPSWQQDQQHHLNFKRSAIFIYAMHISKYGPHKSLFHYSFNLKSDLFMFFTDTPYCIGPVAHSWLGSIQPQAFFNVCTCPAHSITYRNIEKRHSEWDLYLATFFQYCHI